MGLSIGIDTSNYKTSVALIDSDRNILYDKRILLDVKQGERGLRQQEALFQHLNNLPLLIDELSAIIDDEVDIVSASSKPRNVDGSYMPCFLAGTNIGKILSAVLKCRFETFSHQEGHIASGLYGHEIDNNELIAFHLSGGTLEVLELNASSLSIIGGTKDISYGQLIDRIGVKMGLGFPAGEYMDNLLQGFVDSFYVNEKHDTNTGISLPSIKIDDGYINLSGIESAAIRLIEEDKSYYDSNEGRIDMSYAIFKSIAISISDLIKYMLNIKPQNKNYLFVGGVMSSRFISYHVKEMLKDADINLIFSDPYLSGDNAVGIALLGGECIWHR